MKKVNLNVRNIIASLLLTVLFISGGMGLTYLFKFYDDEFGRGIEVSGISLDYLTKDEAKMILERSLFLPDNITLTWNGEAYHIPINNDIASYEYEKALDKAHKSLCVINEISWSPRTISINLPLSVDEVYLLNEIESLRKVIDCPLKDPFVYVKYGIPRVEKDYKGHKLDVSKSFEIATGKLNDGIYDRIPLQVDIIVPEINQDDLRG